MDCVFAGMQWERVMVYMDDICTFASTFEEHQARLNEVLTRLHNAGLKVKLSKCTFLRDEIEFLGHVVSAQGLKMSRDKVSAVLDMPRPSDAFGVRRFLGMVQFYRRFIKDCSRICKPLFELTKENVTFSWRQEHDRAFQLLKSKLCSYPVLRYPDFKKPFVIFADASRTGLGAVLSQEGEDGIQHPIAFASRSLAAAETRYAVTELEGLGVYWAIKHFKPYVYGRKFTVVTDHLPLVYMFRNNIQEGRFAKWISALCGADFNIVYRPGKKHGNCDTLSRVHMSQKVTKDIEHVLAEVDVSQWEERVKWNEFAAEQRADPLLQQRINFIEHGILPYSDLLLKQFYNEKPRYALRDGVLVHITKWGKTADPTVQAVVPRHLRAEILQQCHGNVFAAHFGIAKTFAKLSAKYYWDGYYKDAEHFVKRCPSCAKFKDTRKTAKAPLQPLPYAGPWERVGVDLLGPLPITKRRNRFIIVFTDYFSRWVEAIPLPDTEATTVAEAFITEIICRHGTPNQLLSDKGPQFLSAVMKEVCRLCDIKKSTTSGYHPQTNGLTERCNKVIGTMLAIYTNERQQDWDVGLPFILCAYRASVQSTMSFSPYHILYGREPKLPGELSVSPRDFKTQSQYVAMMTDHLNIMKRFVHQNLQEAQSRQKEHFDRNTTMPNYEVNRLVWLRLERRGVGAKFKPKWGGPYLIIAKPSPVDLVIRLWNSPEAPKQTVHVNRVKPCYAAWQLPPGFEEEEDDDDEVIGHKGKEAGVPDIRVPEQNGQPEPMRERDTHAQEEREDKNSNKKTLENQEAERQSIVTKSGEPGRMPVQIDHKRETYQAEEGAKASNEQRSPTAPATSIAPASESLPTPSASPTSTPKTTPEESSTSTATKPATSSDGQTGASTAVEKAERRIRGEGGRYNLRTVIKQPDRYGQSSK
jgi:hypothetical protein